MKRIFKTIKNILILVSMIGAICLLIHDFMFWGIIPFFTHKFYTLTYLGLLADASAYMVFKIGYMYFEDLFK